MNKKLYIFLALAILVVLWVVIKQDRYAHLSGKTMGTIYNIKIRKENINNSLGDKVNVELERLNRRFSLFDDESELSILNKLKIGERQEISEEMYKMLSDVKDISSFTNGNFDITVAPLVTYWGFGNKNRDIASLFNTQKVSELLANVGMDGFDVFIEDKKYYFVKYNDIKLDMGAVAKGYGVDVIADLLLYNGIGDFVVEIGGEIRAVGDKSDDLDGWNVGVLVPSYEKEDGYTNVINLNNMAVATSGDYRNYFEYDGKKYSHFINPKTGFPVENKLASVTVIDKECKRADAIATALMVMGENKAIEWANDNNVIAFFNMRSNDGKIVIELSNKALGL